jgi:hypothetical protein
VGIGTTAPAANLEVNGTAQFDGAVNFGSGFNVAGNLFASGSYANQNAFLGFAGNATTTGSGNTASGYQALEFNTTGSWNTASGIGALLSNTTGSYNTASGLEALGNNTTGIENTAIGGNALASNNIGTENTGIGYLALYSNTEGYANTASGYYALALNTTGFDNTAIGLGALDANTTGWYNTASGYHALDSNTTGYLNTALGYNAGPDPGTPALTNSTAIGAFADVTQSNSLVLGSISGVNGCGNPCYNTSVGIGTTAPRSALDIDAYVGSGLGPTLTLSNIETGGSQSSVSIDFNTYNPSTSGTYNPAARILVQDNGNYSDNVIFQANIGGQANNGLQQTMLIDSVGNVTAAGIVTATHGFSGQCLSSGTFNTSIGKSCNMDLAEAYTSTQATEPGDLVSLVPSGEATVRKSSSRYESLLLGVVSTNPGLVFDNGKTHLAGDNSVLASKDKAVIALAGRVPVKVSMENGSIRVGDPLTSSSHPGVAMKATSAGKIIGYALAAATRGGKVLTFVQPGYYAAPQLASLQSKLTRMHRENLELRQENASLRSQFAEVLAQVKQIQARLDDREMRTAQMVRSTVP